MAAPEPQTAKGRKLNLPEIVEQPSSEPQQPAKQVRGYKIPSENDYVPPAFPRRPDLFDEVDLGPLRKQDDIIKAYKLWKLQDDCLALPAPPGRPTSRSSGPYACLVRNVYESLMEDPLLPSDTCNKNAQYRQAEDGSSLKGWAYEEVFHLDPEEANTAQDAQRPSIILHGHDILMDRYWTKPKLQAELRGRNLNTVGLVRELRQLLYEDEMQNTKIPGRDADKGSLLPRQDLPEWGIHRKEDYMLKISTQRELSPLDMYTWAILLSPYNPAYWTSRAFLYYQMGHYDLAVGDAYRGQLLCEVLVNPLSRNGQPGLYIRVWDAVERHVLQIRRDGEDLVPEIGVMRKSIGINAFIPEVRKCIHHIISLSLLAMQCWEDYAAAEPYLRTRLVMPDRDANAVRQREGRLREFIRNSIKIKKHDDLEYLFERHYGSIPAQIYPYEATDIIPATDLIAERITKEVLDKSQSNVLPHRQFKIDIDDLKQVCAFATEDIPAGSIIYSDEPSMRGHLHPAKYFPYERRCENCKREITGCSSEGDTSHSTSSPYEFNGGTYCHCSKSRREPMFWCPRPLSESSFTRRAENLEVDREVSQSKKRRKANNDEHESPRSCLEIAKSLYHHKACGKDWSWLHDAMRPNYWEAAEIISTWPRLSHTNEKHGTILSLLLREVFDITLLRRETTGKPNLLAHEIDELMPIILDQAQDIPSYFPFSFAANIRVPFDILSCLGVNIFRDLAFDTWSIQIVLRKLLMAVVPWHSSNHRASGMPETQGDKKRRTKRIIDLVSEEYPDVSPSFPDLYVFPILSLFRNRCSPYHNVDWFWDTTIPNRIVLRAARDIRAGEEMFIARTELPLTRDMRCRILAKPCSCPPCLMQAPSSEKTLQPDPYGHVERSQSPALLVERVTPFSEPSSEDESDTEKQQDPPLLEDKPSKRLSQGRVNKVNKSPEFLRSPSFSPITRVSDESESESVTEEEKAEREQLREMARQINLFNEPVLPRAQSATEATQQVPGVTSQPGEHGIPSSQVQQTHAAGNELEVPPSPDKYQGAVPGQYRGPGVSEDPPRRRGARIRYGGKSTRRDQYNQVSPRTRDRERMEYLKRRREESDYD